jgi:hypothetical protein
LFGRRYFTPASDRPGTLGIVTFPRIELMQPTLLARPFHLDGWIYEEKYDGWRMLIYKSGDDVKLVGRPGRDHTKRFTDLVDAVRGLEAETLILDGEVAIFDERFVSRFEWMRHGKPLPIATPPLFMGSTASTLTAPTFGVATSGRAEPRWSASSTARSCYCPRDGLRMTD